MRASLVAQRLKRLPGMWETRVRSMGWEDPLEKEMAPHSSTLAWRIPWMEEPGGLQSVGSQRVGHDWATSLSLFTFHFRALEKEMATHSSVLAWRIPGTGEPGRLPSMGSHRVGHDWSDLAAAADDGNYWQKADQRSPRREVRPGGQEAGITKKHEKLWGVLDMLIVFILVMGFWVYTKSSIQWKKEQYFYYTLK